MKKRLLAILLTLTMLIGLIPMSAITASAKAVDEDLAETAFSPDNFKAQIKKVSIGAPITGTDGKKYLPVDVHFFAAENLSDSDVVHFLEGYMKLQLKDGGLAESIKGLGMTLMGPLKTDVPLDSNMWNWDWTPYETGGGQGVIKYNVPLLEEGETQTVEKSQATGLTEANGVQVGDQVTIQNETVVNSNGFPADIVQELFPDGPSVFSDPVTFTVEEASKYPKEITVGAVDDKTVAPPAEVVLPYTGQPQACPYTDQAGYYVTLNDPETDAGIYTAVLLLRDGYKWTDGSTEGKPAIWAINKAAITSVTLQHTELTYNTEEQQPGIASVMADSLTVPADGYTVSYSETPLYAGKYTLTVKGKGNFTGSASAEFEIFTVTADTCNHVDYNWRYEDNKDGKTHKVFCWNCGGCLNNSESHQIVYDAIHNQDGEPIGVYNPRCVHCGYEGDSVFCNHTDELEYTDNGLGTHKVTCKRCKKVVAEKESHKIVTTPITTNVGGVEAYLGQFTYSCEKCDYRAEFTCDHKNTGRIEYTPQNTSYPDYTHIARCAKCLMLLVDDQEACTSDGSWEPSSLTTHTSHCSICGQVMTGYHDFKGTRKITKFEATPYKGGLFNLFTRYNYRVYYTETCKVCKGVRNGYFDNPMPSTENWADFRAALQSIVDMSPEQLQSFADNDILGYGKHYLMIPASMLSLIYEATGTNEMNYANLDSYFLLNLTNTSDEGSCKMFDKDGKEIASHKPDDKKSVAPSGADGMTVSAGDGDEEEGVPESELEMWSFTDEDGAALGVSTDLLKTLEDGEHTLTACFSNENGDRAAIMMVFTIYTTEDGQKAIKDLHPQGTMVNADGDAVSMNLSKDTLIYTGEALELPAVTLTSGTGVEYAEDEDYTLTYYQVVEGADGDPIEVEIDREQIKEIGTYNVVANPTRNGVLSGSAWAQFAVIDEADCPHDWETLCDESGHWQHCTICGMTSRIQGHENRTVKCEIKRVDVPEGTELEERHLLCVTVFAECDDCGYQYPALLYNVVHSFDAGGYPLATLRGAEINETGNAIYLDGDPDADTYIFVDGVMVPDDCIDTIYGVISDEFLATIEDGDHEVTILNGDNFTVMTVTVTDHKMTAIKNKNLADYDEMDFEDFFDVVTEYFAAGTDIIYCDLDELLPILGDVDGDGEVSILDVTVLQRKLAQIHVKSYHEWAADVDGSGEADTPDATLLQRWLAYMDVDAAIGEPTPIPVV